MIRERNGSYQVRVYAGLDPVSGKKRHLYGTASSQRAAVKLERDLERQTIDASPTTVTVDRLLDRWLEVGRHAPSTAYTARVRLDKHVRPAIGALPAASITTAQLDRLYLDWEAQGLAPATIVRLHGMIRAAFEQAVTWEWLEKNPAKRCRLPEVPRPTPVVPSAADLHRLLEAAPDDLRAYLRLVAATGMRRGEACALRRSDLDLDRSVIRKARAISQNTERATKTGARYALAIDAGTVDVVRAHLAAQDEIAERLDCEVAGDGFVFSYDPECATHWRPDTVTQRVGRLTEELGIRLRVKDLRDWMVTAVLENGGSIRTAASRAGHARPTTTLDHYAAWVPASDRDAAAVLGELLDG